HCFALHRIRDMCSAMRAPRRAAWMPDFNFKPLFQYDLMWINIPWLGAGSYARLRGKEAPHETISDCIGTSGQPGDGHDSRADRRARSAAPGLGLGGRSLRYRRARWCRARASLLCALVLLLPWLLRLRLPGLLLRLLRRIRRIRRPVWLLRR